MFRPALPARSPILLLTIVACLGVPTIAFAQDLRSDDPRTSEDPRRISDPRGTSDPRDADIKPGIDETLDPVRGPDLFDQLYSDGNHAALSRAMAETPWELTEYIQGHCARWISLTEDRPGLSASPSAESAAAETKVRDLARLADSGLVDTRFSFIVDKLCSLSAEDRILRQEAERLLEKGAAVIDTAFTKDETLRALTPLRQSLSRAQMLEDFRVQSRSHSLIGRVQVLNDRPQAAIASGQEAVRLGRTIRDLDAVWNGWAVIMQASVRQRDFQTAKTALLEQHQMSIEVGDEIMARQILDQVVQLELALGERVPDSLIIYGPRLDQLDPRRRTR